MAPKVLSPTSVNELMSSTQVNKHLESRYAVGKIVGKTFIPSVSLDCEILDFSENITFQTIEDAGAFRQLHPNYRVADVKDLTEWHNKYARVPTVENGKILGMGLIPHEE